MGLDMYLSRQQYISNYDHDPEGQKIAAAVCAALGLNHEDYKNGSFTVSAPIGYWRKANAIHGWFVRVCQDGRDECQETDVSLDQLKQLRELCHAIINKEKEPDELAPTQGFFFGGYEIDEWYYGDLKDTIDIIDKVFNEPGIEQNHRVSFTYRSSW